MAGAAVVVVVLALVLLFEGSGTTPPVRRLIPAAGNGIASYDPYGYVPQTRLRSSSARRPGWRTCSTRTPRAACSRRPTRVNRFRPQIEQAAKAGHVDPDLLEAIVFLESGGEPAVQASPSLDGAVGLTQILAETGTQLLGMHIDTKASAKLTRQIARSHSPARRRRLMAQRARVDERFDPAKSLAATVRYLNFARSKLSNRDDLAVESYHMGVGNLQHALTAYGSGQHPLRAAVLRLEPVASRGGVGRHLVARRPVVDVPVEGAGGQGDHAPVARRPRAAVPARRAPGREELGRGRPAPAGDDDRVRRPQGAEASRAAGRHPAAERPPPAPPRPRRRPRDGRARRQGRRPTGPVPRAAPRGARAGALPRDRGQGDLRRSSRS